VAKTEWGVSVHALLWHAFYDKLNQAGCLPNCGNGLRPGDNLQAASCGAPRKLQRTARRQ